MKITIAGLGYVGTVTAACLAEAGHEVVGLDPNLTKVNQINDGHTPVADLGLDELVGRNVARRRLRVTGNADEALSHGRLIIVCVGTPSERTGDVYLDDVLKVAESIGAAVEQRHDRVDVLITSTIPPGTLRKQILPAIEGATRKRCGRDFGLGFSPEFLREGSAVADFLSPPKTVFGLLDRGMESTLREVYEPFSSSTFIVEPEVAEAIKMVDNAWHALKVAYANEVGRFCRAYSIDSHAVMDLFKRDTKLNISSRYLTPGWAFGGSCLPKDLRTLRYRANVAGVSLPIIDAILPSNQVHIDLALSAIEELGEKRILLVGLAFKSGTDDLRESPSLEIAERLLGKGYDLKIYDEYVNLDELLGANRRYVMERLPHIAGILETDPKVALSEVDAVVFTQAGSAYASLVEQLPAGVPVLDLGGSSVATRADNYRGLAWAMR
jgi:GDP-mannose 6-dehydrogenase